MGWLKFTKLSRVITLGTPDIMTGNDVTDYFRSATRPPFWFFTLRRRSPKWFSRISPNLIWWTYRPSDIFAWNNDVINCFRSAAVVILEKNIFCRKWASGHWGTKCNTEIHPDALCNFTKNCVSSYIRSAVIIAGTCLLFADDRLLYSVLAMQVLPSVEWHNKQWNIGRNVSLPITEVKQRWARLVLGWVTALVSLVNRCRRLSIHIVLTQ